MICRESNVIVDQVYVAEPFAFFHTINAFEESNHLVIDICTYSDGDFLKCLFHETIKESNKSPSLRADRAKMLSTKAERFVLPLMSAQESVCIQQLLPMVIAQDGEKRKK